jgi:hypothetical protein
MSQWTGTNWTLNGIGAGAVAMKLAGFKNATSSQVRLAAAIQHLILFHCVPCATMNRLM